LELRDEFGGGEPANANYGKAKTSSPKKLKTK
jgi:hypothetical protein